MNKSVKFWDRLAKKFDVRVNKYFEQEYIQLLDKIKKYLTNSDNVLDFACGTGLVSIEIADKVKNIDALDISSKMIDLAQKKADDRKINNIHFVQATIIDERYERASYDTILALNIFHLVPNAQQVLQRLNELLKPGGLLISSTACMGEKKTFINLVIFLAIKIGLVPYIKFFKISELEKTIVNSNFQIIETASLLQNSTDYFITAKKV